MASRDPSTADREKRARILDAALEVCARCGVGGARMEEVAALAQVSKGTLYRFFQSKEDLFLATILDSYQESLRILDVEPDRDGDPRARLERFLDGLAQVLTAVSPRMDVHYQAWVVISRDPELQERLYGFLRSFHARQGEFIQRTLRDGQRLGVFAPDVDAGVLADAIMALMSGTLYRTTFDPQRANPERLRACFDVLIRGVRIEGGATGGPQEPSDG